MTEQERMKQGYVWQDDDENMSLQAHTKALVREFNSMPPEDMEGREALLHDIFGKVGKMYGSLHRLQQLLENMYPSEMAPILI